MPKIIAGVLQGAVSGFLAGGPVGAVVGGFLGFVKGVVEQKIADIKDAERKRRLNYPNPDVTANITAVASNAPHVYGMCRVGGVVARINSVDTRLVDNSSNPTGVGVLDIDDDRVDWGSAQMDRDVNGNIVYNAKYGKTRGQGITWRTIQGKSKLSDSEQARLECWEEPLPYKLGGIGGNSFRSSVQFFGELEDLPEFTRPPPGPGALRGVAKICRGTSAPVPGRVSVPDSAGGVRGFYRFYDDTLPGKRPYMDIILILSKGPIFGCEEVYMNGEIVPTYQKELTGEQTINSRGRRFTRSGTLIVPTNKPFPVDNRYHPNYRDGSIRVSTGDTITTLVPTWPQFQIFLYTKADGTEGFSLFNGTESIENDDEMRTKLNEMNAHVESAPGGLSKIHNFLTGYSWAHLRLDGIPQGNAQFYYNGAVAASEDKDEKVSKVRGIGSHRAFAGIPKFEFLLRGKDIYDDYALGHLNRRSAAYLGAWQNPAMIAFDYKTKVQGFSKETINQAALRQAIDDCAERVTITAAEWIRAGGTQEMWENYSEQSITANESSASTPRYDASGVIFEGESSEAVIEELEFAMQGSISHDGGQWYIRAGVNREPEHTILPDDLLADSEWNIQVGPSEQDRVNAVDMSLQQSRITRTTKEEHLYLSTVLKRRINPSALARDNNELDVANLGTRRFVTDPLIAQRLMAIMLRRFESVRTFTSTLKPGRNLRWMNIKPGDIVAINDYEYGINIPRTVVESVTLLEDLTVSLTMRELASTTLQDGTVINIFDDTLDLPPVEAPTLIHPVTTPSTRVGDLSLLQQETDNRFSTLERRVGSISIPSIRGLAKETQIETVRRVLSQELDALVDTLRPSLLATWDSEREAPTQGRLFVLLEPAFGKPINDRSINWKQISGTLAEGNNYRSLTIMSRQSNQISLYIDRSVTPILKLRRGSDDAITPTFRQAFIYA